MGYLDNAGLAYFWKKVLEVSGGSGGGVPKGTIVIWAGGEDDIPEGWALCDGQDGRPDLRDRFVLGGGGTHTIGDTGGEESHTLTVEEMPKHDHLVTTQGDSSIRNPYTILADVGEHGVKRASPTFISGGSQPHNNMPPHYVLCFIIKTAESGGSGGTAEEVYSTEETRIGTWIDGKPLYRKVMNIVSPEKVLTNKTYPFDSAVDTMVSLQAVLQAQKSVSSSKYPLPFLYEENVYLSVWYSESSLYARAGSGAVEYLSQPVTVTLEYTKTTD